MKEFEIVGVGLGVDQFNKEKQDVLKGLDELIGKIGQFGKVRTDLGFTKGFADFNKAVAGIMPALESLETATQNVSKASKELARLKALEAKATKDMAAAALSEAKAKTEAAKADKIKTQTSAAAEKQSAAEKKSIRELASDYHQLSRAYNDAALRAKNYALQLGENHEVTRAAVKDAKEMHDILLRVDQAVGQSQRNVGNYKSAFDGLGFSVSQISRELPSLSVSVQQFALAISNNIPMLADEIARAKKEISALKAEGQAAPSLFSKIAGSIFSWQVAMSVAITVFTIFSKQIVEWVGSLFKTSKEIERVAASAKVMKEAFADSGVQQAVKDVNELRNEISLAKEGFLNKAEVVKHYNETIGKTTGQVKTLEEAERQLSKNAEAYIQFTLLKAAANLALEKSAESILKSELKQQQQADKFAKGVSGRAGRTQLLEMQIDSEGFKKQSQEFDKVAQDLFDKASAMAKKFKFSFFGNADEQDKEAKDRAKKAKEFADRQAQAEFDLYKASLEHQASYFESIGNNEALSYSERATALGLFLKLQSQIITAERDFQVKEEGLGAKEIEKIKGEAQIRLIDIEHKTQKKLTEIFQKGIEDRRKKAEQDQRDKISQAEDRLSSRVLRNQTLENIEMNRLNNDFLAGKIKSVEDYEKQKEAISAKYREKDFQDQIKALEDLLMAEGLTKEEREKLENDLSALKEKRSATAVKKQIDGINKVKDAEIKLAEKRKELLEELKELIETVLLAGIERGKNALQERQDQSDQYYERESENIRNSTLSEEDKANRIKLLEAEQKARNQKFERDKRELNEKQARYEKAFAITSIIQSTAAAVIAALRPPPVGLGPVAGGPLAAITAAIGAAQIANVLARPIPKYAEGAGVNGRPEHPGGIALVGEGRHSEIVTTPSGQSFIADRPMLVDIPKYTKVLPMTGDYMNSDIYNSMIRGSVKSLGLYGKAQEVKTRDTAILASKLDRVVQAIQDGKVRPGKPLSKEALRAAVQLEQAKSRWRYGN